MSRITRAQKIAEQVLKPKGRDYEKFSRAADARIDKVLAEQGIPMKPQRGGLLGAAKARGMISPKTESDIRRVVGTGAATAGGALALGTKGFSEPYDAQNMVIDPAAIGAIAARMGKSISEAVDEASGLVEQAAMPATLFFQEIQQGYQDELERQRNMEMYGQPTVPELESGAIEPVSLLFAEGGSATLSNRDKGMALAMGAAGMPLKAPVQDMKMRVTDPVSPPQTLPITADTPPAQPTMLGMDNEPRFAERPPFSQIFTIENDIKNKYKEYEVAVRNNELLRAQNLINEIDELEQQKIMIQNQAASPLSNRDMEIANILESISQ